MITVEEIMGYEPCGDYPRERVAELWAGRESLSPREVAELPIPHEDKVWALCYCLASRDLSAVVAFAQGCAMIAGSGWAAFAASAREAAREAAVGAARGEAMYAAAYAAADAADAAVVGSATWGSERQRQLEELVRALEATQ